MRGKNGLSTKLWKAIPFLDSLLSVGGQLGVNQAILLVLAFLGPIVMTIWAAIYSQLPPWALVLVFIGAFGIIAKSSTKVLEFIDRAKNRLALDEAGLGDEADRLSSKIRALLGRHRADIQNAWWSDSQKEDFGRENHTIAVGRLISEFSREFEADAWNVILAADHIYGLDDGQLWRLQHGVTNESDIHLIANMISQIATWSRYGKPNRGKPE